MKKTALAILMLFLIVNVVCACELPREEEEYRQQIGKIVLVFFFAAYALIIPIVVLYFLRRRNGMWTIVTGLALLVLYTPLSLFASIFDMCGNSGFWVIIGGFIFMLFLFAFQLISWFKGMNKIKPTLP